MSKKAKKRNKEKKKRKRKIAKVLNKCISERDCYFKN